MKALKIYAGAAALRHIQAHGLCAADIQMLLAASGGPKWFALESIDRYLLSEWFQQRQQPLHLLGTSSGAFRLACYAQQDPQAALGRFLESYLGQQYSQKPSAKDIGRALRDMVTAVLGTQGAAEIIQHPFMRFNTLVTRCRGLGAASQPGLQALGMGGAMLANAVATSAMRPFFERVLFHHTESLPITHFPNFPARKVALTTFNIEPVLQATGSIPIVIEGVRDIPGAPAGMYRDGGITDYQFDLPCKPPQGLVLYPHYSAVPPKGVWFDKALRWRKAQAQHYSHTIILAPSPEFSASLPGGRVPERQDFHTYPDYVQRRQHWLNALQQMQRLGDELAEIDQRGQWAAAEPLPW